MKIAITGHTSIIGRAFAEQLAQRGHSIVGIS
jgi:nucleoside-diphosphate-sugar epimerase